MFALNRRRSSFVFTLVILGFLVDEMFLTMIPIDVPQMELQGIKNELKKLKT